MLERARTFLEKLAESWPNRPALLHLFAAKVAPASKLSEVSSGIGIGEFNVAADSLPDGPGIWQRTDRQSGRTVLRVKDQNGKLYANTGSVAVPVVNPSGAWARVE